jgi:putative ABC transport system permease protein
LLAVSFIVGMATSVIAAAIPARNAARIDPVLALQKGRYQVLSAGENRLRVVCAAIIALVSIGCLALSESRPVFYAGYVLALLAVLLVGPQLSLGLARLIRPVLKRLSPIEGALAADSLIQTPRRTSASVTALMLSLALVVAFEGMAGASYRSIVSWMNTTLNPDLFVVPSINTQTIRFPAPMRSEILALPGVERVQTLRNVRTTFRQSEVTVVAVEMSSVAQTDASDPVEGHKGDMYRQAASGAGLLVSDNLAQLQHLKLGEVVEVDAPYGQLRLPIVGIVLDYSDQQGAILMDRSVFTHYWEDDSVNMFRVYVKQGLSAAAVREQILLRYAGRRQVFVLTNNELKGNILKIAQQWFAMTFVQIAIAVLVAMLGIVNTMTVSIADRRRELGVLRAVGALHGQVRRTIWIEALAVATVGLILGYVMGAINLYYLLEIVRRDIAGMRLDYQFPLTTAVAVAPVILVASLVAALWPAESAVRESLVEALEYE